MKEAYIEAMQTVVRREPVHRWNMSFFYFMTERAKCLTEKKQDELMHKCHAVLFEVQHIPECYLQQSTVCTIPANMS